MEDGSKVSVMGLTESMAHARAERRPADIEAPARLLELIRVLDQELVSAPRFL